MEQILIALVVILLLTLGAILVLFHRQGQRLSEEIQHAIDSEDIKSHYLSDACCNFRGPLKAIICNCDAITQQPCFKDHPQVVKAIEDIRFQSKQLQQYTDEILEISNTEGNIPHSVKIQVNLIELIMSYRREILYDVHDNVQVNLRTEMSPHTKVWLDTTMFRQLIMHLLRAAANNTFEGHITIRYAEEKEGLRFWIENTCEPIPHETLETMFTKQINPQNNEKDTSDKDTVISLSICKAIIDDLKGEIKATSEESELGYVNIITFWFPCSLSED